MQINVSSRHGDLSPSTQELISSKAGKLQKFYDRITAIEVTADLKDQDRPTVEIRVSAEQSPDFVATDSGNNVVSAAESVVQKLEQQLRKHKEKKTSHRKDSLKHVETQPEEE